MQIESLLLPCRPQVTASLGVAMANDFEDSDQLYIRADRALYLAKATGGNTTKIDVSFEDK